jgi:hypothetical protein
VDIYTAGAAGSADADAVAAAVKPVSAVPAQHRPPPAAESVAAAAVNVAAAAVKPVDDGQPAVPAKVKKARVDNPLVDAHPPSSSLDTEILACLGGEVSRPRLRVSVVRSSDSRAFLRPPATTMTRARVLLKEVETTMRQARVLLLIPILLKKVETKKRP